MILAGLSRIWCRSVEAEMEARQLVEASLAAEEHKVEQLEQQVATADHISMAGNPSGLTTSPIKSPNGALEQLLGQVGSPTCHYCLVT